MSEDLIKRDSVIKILHTIDEKFSAEQCDDKAKQCMYECAREMLSILQKAIDAIPCADEESIRFSDVAKALDKAIGTPSADRPPMSDLIPWDDFVESRNGNIFANAEPTQIACPKCGKRIYKRTDITLACYPPKRQYFCGTCDWVGSA